MFLAFRRCIYVFYVILTSTTLAQAAVLYPLLKLFGIHEHNLGWFVLDNALNNDTTLVELAKKIPFIPKERRLRCFGHILNLIAESYLFGQDERSFQQEFDAAGPAERRALGEVVEN